MANFSVRRSMVVAGVTATALLFLYACKVDDENPGNAKRDGGPSTTADGPSSEGSTPGTAACTRLGGAPAVGKIADAILARVRADCRLSANFGNVGTDGELHLKECFAIQVRVFFNCDGVTYPGTDSNGDACRSMTDAHQNLGLTSTDFTAFLDDAQAELATRGLTTDETKQVISGFLGTRASIVQDDTPYNANCSCPDGKYKGAACSDPDAGTPDAASDAADASDG